MTSATSCSPRASPPTCGTRKSPPTPWPPLFGDDVTTPVRLHVAAKRYLGAIEPAYLNTLSPASVQSLELQGGVFTPVQAEAFATQPHALDAVRLRRYDDQAKVVGLSTPRLGHYMEMAGRCLRTR